MRLPARLCRLIRVWDYLFDAPARSPHRHKLVLETIEDRNAPGSVYSPLADISDPLGADWLSAPDTAPVVNIFEWDTFGAGTAGSADGSISVSFTPAETTASAPSTAQLPASTWQPTSPDDIPLMGAFGEGSPFLMEPPSPPQTTPPASPPVQPPVTSPPVSPPQSPVPSVPSVPPVPPSPGTPTNPGNTGGAPLGPVPTLDELGWSEAPGFRNWTALSYSRTSLAITLKAGEVSYRLGTTIEDRSWTDGQSDGTILWDRGKTTTEFTFQKTQGAVVVDAPTAVTSYREWDSKVATTLTVPISTDNPFWSRVPSPVARWDSVEVASGQILLAKGVMNAAEVEYAYTAESRQNSVATMTTTADAPNGASVTTTRITGDYLNRYLAGDWVYHDNASQQGTLSADRLNSGTYTTTQTKTVNRVNGTPTSGSVVGSGSTQGTYHDWLGLVTYYTRHPDPQNDVRGRYELSHRSAGTASGTSSFNYSLAPDTTGPLTVTSGTSSSLQTDRETIDLDRTSVREDFDLETRLQPASSPRYATSKGYDSRSITTTDGERVTTSARDLKFTGGAATLDSASTDSTFRRKVRAIGTGEDAYYLRDSSVPSRGDVLTDGANKYKVWSEDDRFDSSVVRYDKLTGTTLTIDEWQAEGVNGMSYSDKGTVTTQPVAPSATEYEMTRDLTGPSSSSGRVEQTFTVNLALAAVAGGAAALTSSSKASLTSTDELSGAVVSDVKSTGAQQFTVKEKKQSVFAPGGIVQKRDVVNLVAQNGVPQSGSMSAESTFLGKDTVDRSVSGTLTYTNGMDPALTLRTEKVDLTMAWWGENTKGKNRTSVVYASGTPTVTVEGDVANTGGSSLSGYTEVKELTGFKPWVRTDYTPQLAAADGRKASYTFDNSYRLTSTTVEGALNSGDFVSIDNSKTDYKINTEIKRDLTVPGQQTGDDHQTSTYYDVSSLNRTTDRQVVGGQWNAARTTFDDLIRVKSDGEYYKHLVVDWTGEPLPGTGNRASNWSDTTVSNKGGEERERRETGSRGRGGDAVTLKSRVDAWSQRDTTVSSKNTGAMGETHKGNSRTRGTDTVKTTDDYTWENGAWKRTSFDHKIYRTSDIDNSSESTSPSGYWYKSSYLSLSYFKLERAGTPTAWTGTKTEYTYITSRLQDRDNPNASPTTTTTGSPLTFQINNQFDPGWWSDTWVVAGWNELGGTWAGRQVNWLWNNGKDIARIGVGAIDVGFGAAFSLTGYGVLAGAPLMAVGIDQILTGSMNLRYGRVGRDFSVLESGAFWVTGNETIAVLAPAAASLSLYAGGRWLTAGSSTMPTAGTYMAEQVVPGTVAGISLWGRVQNWWTYRPLIRTLVQAGPEGIEANTLARLFPYMNPANYPTEAAFVDAFWTILGRASGAITMTNPLFTREVGVWVVLAANGAEHVVVTTAPRLWVLFRTNNLLGHLPPPANAVEHLGHTHPYSGALHPSGPDLNAVALLFEQSRLQQQSIILAGPNGMWTQYPLGAFYQNFRYLP